MNFLRIAQNIIDRMDGERPTTIYNADLGALSQEIRRVREHINLAYNVTLMTLGKINENSETITSFTTSAGVESYDIPSGILNISQLQIGAEAPISLIPWPEYNRMKADVLLITVNGYPSHATIYNRDIYLYPVPDAAYTVSVWGQESMTELNLDADEPDLQPEFHRTVQELALAYEMAYLGDPAAGTLVVNENGSLSGQGGQAAIAVGMLNMARRQSAGHEGMPARLTSWREIARSEQMRWITRS